MKILMCAILSLVSINAMADGTPVQIRSNFEFNCDRSARSNVTLVLSDETPELTVLDFGSTGMDVSPEIELAMRRSDIGALEGLSHKTEHTYQGQLMYSRTFTITAVNGNSFDVRVDSSDSPTVEYKNCRPSN